MGQSGNSQVCGNCGTPNSLQDQFCSKCGYLLASGPPDKTLLATTMSIPQRRITGALTPGILLGKRYHIVQLIGKGGFGAVYKATDGRFQSRRTIAIKEMSDAQLNPTEKAKAIQDFGNEAGLLVELSHPNLPTVSDFFEDGGKVLPVKLQAPRASFRQQAFEQQHRIGSGYHGGATIACARHCDEGWSASPNCVSLMHSNSCRYAFACWKRADHWLSQPDYSTHEDPIAHLRA